MAVQTSAAILTGGASISPTAGNIVTFDSKCTRSSAYLNANLQVDQSGASSMCGGAGVAADPITSGAAVLCASASLTGMAMTNGAAQLCTQTAFTSELVYQILVSSSLTMSGTGSVSTAITFNQELPFELIPQTNAGQSNGATATVTFWSKSQGGLACLPQGSEYVSAILTDGESPPATRHLYFRFLEEVKVLPSGQGRVQCHIWFHGQPTGKGAQLPFFIRGKAFKLLLGTQGRIIGGGVITGGPPARDRDLPFRYVSFTGAYGDAFSGT